ncbi:cytosolic 5'-nucleotidase 3-like isoform X2 [Stegodyphus dumicola]|nr:cytosolic 5'-nucleotidase 3-like isoform X2 [Stegodyphus dumicola]XP_035216812.1 cytosolic 5'-nucleotidase 3-like isoform X2 [Stegodyphus dumicola]XP_035216813.1 cytosolic 5'-nucleotidase 3-like isoform X2 [Stegodyphus dumicola]
MEAFKKETVHIKDHDHVEEIVSQFVKGGASKLQVIADFDYTLSRAHKDGVKCDTTYGILKKAPFVPEDYKIQTTCLFEYYHPIEIDPNLTKVQKIPYMVEWYTKSLNLMPKSGIKKDQVPEMVESSNVQLRDGCDVVFKSLHQHNVPLLIFSAGVGDLLKEVLRQKNMLYPNMKIIANFMRFDEKDKLAGFKGAFIHTFNKNLTSVENSDYFNHLKSRDNIILLGDSLGDLDMTEGVNDINSILRIGFLNHRIEEYLPEYLDAFDIVLTDDQTMDVLIGLLKNVL